MQRRAWFGPLPHPEMWVFITGCSNSGTTLLHDIMATLPGVGSLPTEGHFLTDQLTAPYSVGMARLWATEPDRFRLEPDDERVDAKRLKRQWGAAFNDAGRPILIERSPTTPVRARWLERRFERAHFIGIVRNGYAVAEGINRRLEYPLDLAARQWNASNQIMLDEFGLVEHSTVIRYEALTERPEETIQGLMDFIGLSDPELRLADREWSIHERREPIRNMNQSSLDRMGPEEMATVRREAADMLARFGY
jgi:hypothetical protein